MTYDQEADTLDVSYNDIMALMSSGRTVFLIWNEISGTTQITHTGFVNSAMYNPDNSTYPYAIVVQYTGASGNLTVQYYVAETATENLMMYC